MLIAGMARAQFEQYIGPGSLGIKEPPTKERFETAMQEAPYRLGPLRLGLWFTLQDISWIDNVYGTVADQKSDFTATASLGVHGYLPAGPKLVFALYALPEYVWWQDLDYLRGWNGKYGVGVFGYFNRVTLEIQAGNWQTQQFYSSVNPVPVNVEQQRGAATLEVEVLGRLSVFGTAGEDRWRYEEQRTGALAGEILPLSDRNETLVEGGLRYSFSEAFALAIGYQQLTADFVNDEHNRSNSGDGRFIELDLRGHRLWATARVTDVALRPEGGSEFESLDTTTGHAQIGWKPGGKLELQAYGGRSISYTLLALASYYVDERWGLGAQMPLGWRSTARLFWEQGRNEYPRMTGESVGRTDDLDGYGASLNFKLGRGSAVGLEGSRTDYTSILPEYTRSITRVRVTLSLAGAGGQWW